MHDIKSMAFVLATLVVGSCTRRALARELQGPDERFARSEIERVGRHAEWGLLQRIEKAAETGWRGIWKGGMPVFGGGAI